MSSSSMSPAGATRRASRTITKAIAPSRPSAAMIPITTVDFEFFVSAPVVSVVGVVVVTVGAVVVAAGAVVVAVAAPLATGALNGEAPDVLVGAVAVVLPGVVGVVAGAP